MNTRTLLAFTCAASLLFAAACNNSSLDGDGGTLDKAENEKFDHTDEVDTLDTTKYVAPTDHTVVDSVR